MVKLLTVALCVLAITACASPRGDNPAEQIANALAMRDKALATLCEVDPDLKQEIEKSLGYAVFSNFSVHPGLLSFATGYGVLTRNATGEVTHSRWTRLTIGPGIAVKGLYALVIFHDQDLMESFAEGRWTVMGQVEASLVFGDFGGCLARGWLYDRKANVRYRTHTGVALELEIVGFGKVSNNSKLNRPVSP